MLGLDRTSAQRKVLDLERWTRRILIMDDVLPHNLSPDGQIFMPFALQALSVFDKPQTDLRCDLDNHAVDLRNTNRSKVSLNTFKSLAAFRSIGCTSYDRAGALIGIGSKSVRSDISIISKVLKFDVVAGFSTIRLTDQGFAFLEQIEDIIGKLEAFRSALPLDYDPARTKAERQHTIFKKHARRLYNGLRLYNNRCLSPEDQLELDHVRKVARAFEELACFTKNEYGSFNEDNASNISIYD